MTVRQLARTQAGWAPEQRNALRQMYSLAVNLALRGPPPRAGLEYWRELGMALAEGTLCITDSRHGLAAWPWERPKRR